MVPAAPLGTDDATFTNRARRATTFVGGRDEPVHRWFTITPAYAPALVGDCADHLGLGPGDAVLDPFVGAGTTAVWCRLAGHACTAVEWNPALAFIAHVKGSYAVAPDLLAAAGADFARRWRADLPADAHLGAYVREHARYVPAIAHPERWWAPPALAALTAARRQLAADAVPAAARPGVELALLGSLLAVSRARYSHASLTFDHRAPVHPAGVVIDTFTTRLAVMVDDLGRLAGGPDRPARVLRGNSLRLDTLGLEPGGYTRLICSPPYPNRYSYARETRPHLYFLDLIASARAVGDLECEALGGTWGRATSLLSRPHEPEPDVVAPLMAAHLPALRAAHPLMANYAVRYFNDLWQHARGVGAVMAPRARLAYVVGNSKLGGVEVPTAAWLLRLFEEAGWRPLGAGIHALRKRNSRPGLLESVVFIER